MNLYDFYNSILNIGNSDKLDVIKKIVSEEKEKLLTHTDSLEGFCIYIASQIEDKLKQENITTYYIDLNELLNVDHVFLIAEYMADEKIKRILIDPTFEQFTKTDNRKLLKLDEWPSQKLDADFVNSLLESGYYLVDNDKFNSYINAFSKEKLEFNLDEFLLEQRGKGLK